MDSTGMEIVHTMSKDGRTNPTPVGKVMKILIHGIHHIITIMKSMNTNHLYKRKPGLKRKSKNVLLKNYKRKPSLRQQSKSALLNYCKSSKLKKFLFLKFLRRIKK